MSYFNEKQADIRHEIVALIPCYNTRKYIRAAIVSLLEQTLTPNLIVVIDDCSTDNFEDEIQDLIDTHDNIVIHHNPQNLGVSGSRNEGIKNYPADFYILNDADDISLPKRVERSMEFMKAHPNCGVMGGFIEYIDSKGKIFGKGTQLDCYTEKDAERYRNGLPPVGLFTSAVCIRGDVLREHHLLFDTRLIAAEDMDLWNRVLETGQDVLVLPEFLSQYRVHGNSICTSRFKTCKQYSEYVKENIRCRRTGQPSKSFEDFCKLERERDFHTRIKYTYSVYSEYFYRTGGWHLIEGRYFQGGCMLLLALLMKPKRIHRLICQRLGKRICQPTE